MRGKLQSGDRIKIDAVAKEFGVSIIPVREAIRMLDADHLIEILPRRSPVVSGLSPDEVLEIAEIRLALEPVALAAAIPHHTPESLRACEAILKNYRDSRDPWEQVDLNRRFHLALYEPCGRKRMMKIISDQYDGMTRSAHVMVIRSSKEVGKSLTEHRAILKACRRENVEEAVTRLHAHLDASIARLRKELELA